MKVQVNLCKLLEQAAPQVWGGDERNLLYSFLARNTDEQLVEINLDECVELSNSSRLTLTSV